MHKKSVKPYAPRFFYAPYGLFVRSMNYNFGPAATKALPASLPVNLAKFLMKR